MMKLSGKTITLLIGVMLIVLFYAQTFTGTAKVSAEAKRGKLDLSNTNLNDGTILLNGEWELYWSQLLTPDQLPAAGGPDHGSAVYWKVPGSWTNETVDGQHLSNHGYATYRLTVKLNPANRGQQLAIYVPSVATAYRLWIDGRLRAANGVVGTSRQDMIPKNYRKVVYFDADREQIELVFQVSNFVQRKGGLWDPVRLGTAEQISAKRETHIVVDMFLIGSLCTMGFYHLGLFGIRRKDRAPLYFGALCLTFALRMMVIGDTLAVRLVPALPWEAVVKAEYISGMISLPLFMYYCCIQYAHDMRRIMAHISLIVTGLFCIFVLITEARVYTYIMLPFQVFAVAIISYAIYVFTRAMLRRRDGAVRNYIALVIFFATMVNDFLMYNQVVQTPELMSFGLLVYLFIQAVNLSIEFSRAYAHSERLSVELSELNATLEGKVRERTLSLEQSNAKLQQAHQEMERLEASRRQLLSDISHELKTPLTSILGYSKAIIDGVIAEPMTKYLELIHQKAKILEHIFRDLLELSKLETRKVEFHYTSVPARKLLRRFYEKYEWDLRSKELNVALMDADEFASGQEAIVEVDEYRLEQVFANLMMNAKKFTPAGGSVTVDARIEKEPDGAGYRWVVGVSDTGPGMPEEELPHVFDRFFKGKHSRNVQSEGAGLGLAISKEIVAYHRGDIGAVSRLGAGSTFYFSLPVLLVADEYVS